MSDVVTSLLALPGQCWRCGAPPGGDRQRFIDTKMQVEFYGAVYLCELCVGEDAGALGWVDPQTYRALIARIAQLEKLRFEAEKKSAGYRKALDGLLDAGHMPAALDDASNVVSAAQVDAQRPQGAADSLGAGAGTSSQQGDDEGVGELRPDDRVEQSTGSDTP